MRLGFLIFLLFFTTSAWAKLLRVPYQGIRQLGMGNAFVALADDSNCLWYNPAGLARVSGPHFNMLDLQIGFDSMDTWDRLKNFMFKGDVQHLLRPDTEAIRIGTKPTFTMPFFGFSVFDNVTSFTDFQNLQSLDATVDIYTANDVGLIAGIAIPATKYFSFGLSARAFERNAIDAHITAQELLEEVEEDPLSFIQSRENFTSAVYDHISKLVGFGYAVGYNAGFLATLPLGADAPKVTFAGAAEDIGQTTFKKMGSLPTPKAILPSYHLGTSVSYKVDSLSKMNFALDFRNATEHLPWQKKLHLGVEYRHKWFALRTGVYDAYLSLGFSVEFPPHTRVHFATYQSELDDTKLVTRGQRWYVMQFIVGFNPF